MATKFACGGPTGHHGGTETNHRSRIAMAPSLKSGDKGRQVKTSSLGSPAAKGDEFERAGGWFGKKRRPSQ